MKFVARLVTDRQLERPVQRFIARDRDIEATAKQMLSPGDPRDRVEVFEIAEIPVSSFIPMPDGTIERIDSVTSERKCLG